MTEPNPPIPPSNAFRRNSVEVVPPETGGHRSVDQVLEDMKTLKTRYTKMQTVRIDEIELLECPHLSTLLPDCDANCSNIRHAMSAVLKQEINYDINVDGDDIILADIVRDGPRSQVCRAYVRAGPRRRTYFDPREVIAGIVTCGGLCPGLNNVIRDTTMALYNLYGVKKVLGFVGGYGGIYKNEPLVLTLDNVARIHTQGGTMLSSSRGGFDAEQILERLEDLGVSQLYCIGGDGTMRGANKLAIEAAKRGCTSGRPIAVAGVPKTIDNDICLLDRSFGFFTAVQEALRAIRSAKTEASCAVNGVGVVKLMGRHAGFIAAHAALASGDCDLCLIPEVPIAVEGPNSCLDHIVRIIDKQGHAVVVVAEGAGEDLLGESAERDDSGNRKLPAIGYWMKQKIESHMQGLSPPREATVKYIDPSYMIRSVPANAADSVFCLLLAQNAVHGAMAGYTGFCTGLCNDRVVYLPMTAIVEGSPRFLNPFGRTWERVLSNTGQPNTAVAKQDPAAVATQLHDAKIAKGW